MLETDKFITAVNDIHESINTGFNAVYQKIDKKFSQCDKRLTSVETIIEVKKALCKKKKEDDAKKRDYWLPVIRIISAAGIVALLVIAWEKLVELWGMVP